MASRDFVNSVNTVNLLPPGTTVTNANTAFVSNILDTAGYEGVTLVILAGALTDANATFATTVEHGDNSALADTAVPAASDTVGLASASLTFADDNRSKKFGYVGSKRYVRVTVTPTGNDAGAATFAIAALLTKGRNLPEAAVPAI